MNNNGNIKGDFHFHSLHSSCQGKHLVGQIVEYNSLCGTAAVAEIIEVSKNFKNLGFEYLAVTNHANDPFSTEAASKQEIELLLAHIEEIGKLNSSGICPLNVLSGTEVNIINRQGEVSMPDEILSKLDVVVASNHRPTEKLDRQDIKSGFLGAIANKQVNIIGHLTRYIHHLQMADWQEIIAACEANNKIIEYNIRLPFRDEVFEIIARSNVLVSIGSDTHPEIINQYQSLAVFLDEYIKKMAAAIDYLEKSNIDKERIVNNFNLTRISKLFKFTL